jgi:uncharacterized protein (UPF0276 family)
MPEGWLGLGLGSNLAGNGLPQPYRMLDAEPGLFDYVEYSAPLDLDAARRDAPLFRELEARLDRTRALFHPVHLNLYGPALEAPEALRALDHHARAVGSPWVSNDVAWWHAGGHVFPGHLYLPPPLSQAGLADCARHARHVQAALSVPLLLENPAFLARRGDLHVLRFMAELRARTGCGLILDLGHLWSHQLLRGLPLDAGLGDFPLDAVVEIHLAGGVVTRRGPRAFYVDDHPQPVHEELFELLADLVPRCPRLRAVTYEGDGQPDPIAAATLRRLRRTVPPPDGHAPAGASQSPPRLEGAPALGDAPFESRPWSLYDESFARASPAEDAEGTAMEVDFRLAVVAERLDRAWPWTRLLVAPGRAELLAFLASPELASLFDGACEDLAQAFARFAALRVREAALECAREVFAFERELRDLLERAERRPHARGALALAPGVALGTASRDWSELRYAAAALRHHLEGRARASGLFEAGGLEALRHVAARAPSARWRFVARRDAAGFEILPLPAGLAAVLERVERAEPVEAGDARLRWALQNHWVRGSGSGRLAARPPTRSPGDSGGSARS